MDIKNSKDYQDLITLLQSKSAGQDFIDFSNKIIKTKRLMIGVRTPELKKIAKQIYKGDHDKLFEFGENKFYEEVIVKGLVLCLHKDRGYVYPRLNKLSKIYDCWADVDLTARLACVKGDKKDFEYFCEQLKSDKEFVVRLGVVGLMKFFIDDYCRVFDALEVVKCDKYYVNMAISWLISEVLVRNSQNAIEIMQKIIKNHHFNEFIINKSIQKASESFRIDDKIKLKLRELKIR